MKFRIEKILHEVIRDLPEAATINSRLDRGYITTAEALEELARIIRKEKQNRTI